MKTKPMVLKGLLLLVSTVMSLVAAELVLRAVAHTTKHLDYRDAFRRDGLGPGGFLTEGFAGDVQNGYGGTVHWRNNSQGFRNDKDFAIPPAENTFRVLSLGDSFTGGYRVGQDQTFSFLVERSVSAHHPSRNIEVMVSVIEDPLTGLYYLASRGNAYSPDLVVLGITLGNDLAQIYSNLGQTYDVTSEFPFIVRLNDRGTRDAWVKKLEAQTLPADCLTPRVTTDEQAKPVWSDIYPWWPRNGLRLVTLLSQIGRRFHHEAPQTVVSNWEEYRAPRLFDSNGLGIFLKLPPENVRNAYEGLFKTLGALSRFCRAADLECLVVIFPQRFQIQDQDWDKTIEVYGLRDECFDRQLPNRRIAEFCRKNDIDCLDPTPQMRAAYEGSRKSLYFPNHDMHWNARGHRVLADVLGPAIERLMVK
jgi:hypothetical protein